MEAGQLETVEEQRCCKHKQEWVQQEMERSNGFNRFQRYLRVKISRAGVIGCWGVFFGFVVGMSGYMVWHAGDIKKMSSLLVHTVYVFFAVFTAKTNEKLWATVLAHNDDK